MDQQAPYGPASAVARPGGADMLRRSWSEVVAAVIPEHGEITDLLDRGLGALEAADRLDEAALVALAEEGASAFRETGLVDVARVLSKRLRRAVYEFLLALDATPLAAAEPEAGSSASAAAATPQRERADVIIGLEEVEARGRPMPVMGTGADDAVLAELARVDADPTSTPDLSATLATPAPPVPDLDDDGVAGLVDDLQAEAWSRTAEERFTEIEGHAWLTDSVLQPLELDDDVLAVEALAELPDDVAPAPPEAGIDVAPAAEPEPEPAAAPAPQPEADPPLDDDPLWPIGLPRVDNQIPITRREDFVVSDPAEAVESARDVPPLHPSPHQPVAPVADPAYPADAEWLPAAADPRQSAPAAPAPEPRDPLLAGWSTVSVQSDFDPTPSFPSSRFDPRAGRPANPAAPRRPVDAGYVMPGSMVGGTPWNVRPSPRQQVLAERMAQKRREEAVRAALEAAQIAAALGEADRRKRRKSTDLERLPDVEGLRTVVEELLRRKKGADAGSLLQRAAQEQGGREVADLCIDAGDRCRALGQSRAATNCYLAAWRADPIYEAPLWRLSDICLSDREVELAVGYLERIATLMRTRGDDEGALGVYRKIVTLAPDRTDIRDVVRLAQTTGRLD